MKILVMRCTKVGAWWKNCIGKTYEVVRELEDDFLIKAKNKGTEGNHILKKDCEVIK